MGIIAWIILGLIVGVIAKYVFPGNENLGWAWTIVLGIIGSIVGGWVAGLVGLGAEGGAFSIGNLIISVVGALIVLFIYSAIVKK